jgi:glycosyltransferase involved in cell wall biosynthesis
MMRTELLPLSHLCDQSKKCENCLDIGYRLPKPHRLDPVARLEDTFRGSVGNGVTLTCGVVDLPDFEGLVEKYIPKLNLVLHFRKWQTLRSNYKVRVQAMPFAIIFDNILQMESLEIPDSARLYLLLTKDSWQPAQLENLPPEVSVRLNFFFPVNTYGRKNLFSVEEILELSKSLLKKFPLSHVGSPFGHDLLDIRNTEHLSWIFSVSPSVTSSNTHQFAGKVSVVVPTINRAKFIRKILRALGQQNLSSDQFEIIVVDDGGVDDTSEEVARFVDQFPRHFIRYFYINRKASSFSMYNSNRAGPIRNFGAKMARGDILLFLDSDILVPNSYISRIILEHDNYEVVLPRRVYLNQVTSNSEDFDISNFNESHTMKVNWQSHLEKFHNAESWLLLDNPWKYFMTYCLSVRREIFFQTGGFRTNYISYGYEDLDWGFRAVNVIKKLKHLSKLDVYHLYHFDRGSEYTLAEDFRFFQLAMTSRVFVAQNVPHEAEYLIEMSKLKSTRQKIYFYIYMFVWKGCAIGRAKIVAIENFIALRVLREKINFGYIWKWAGFDGSKGGNK